jgi:hypothetical protein
VCRTCSLSICTHCDITSVKKEIEKINFVWQNLIYFSINKPRMLIINMTIIFALITVKYV